MNLHRVFCHVIACCLLSSSVIGQPSTAAGNGGDFQLKPGEFPPDGSSHAIAGELIALDHVNRTGTLRPDRTDAQRRGDWDMPLDFTLLPYGSIFYRGAPASLRDIVGSPGTELEFAL